VDELNGGVHSESRPATSCLPHDQVSFCYQRRFRDIVLLVGEYSGESADPVGEARMVLTVGLAIQMAVIQAVIAMALASHRRSMGTVAREPDVERATATAGSCRLTTPLRFQVPGH
jgi:hypothetical protein